MVTKPPGGALFSRDRKHRYLLWRTFDAPGNWMLFVGLNPSMADETSNDPTIRRIIGFAKREQAGGVLVANLFSYCATDPAVLRAEAKPTRPANDQWLRAAHELADHTVACWGVHGSHMGQSDRIGQMLEGSLCLGTTRAGEPRHPLYLRLDAPLGPWPL